MLDTVTWLWLDSDPDRIPGPILRQLQRSESELYLSVASAWEIAIKYSLGKLPLPNRPARYVPAALERMRVVPLRIEQSHALAVADLPRHHADPFDRLLIVQAQIEKLAIVTPDSQFDAYEVELVRI